MKTLKEAFNSLKKTKTRSLVAVTAVGLNLLLLSLLLQGGRNLNAFLGELNKNISVVAYVADKVKQPELDSLLLSIGSLKGVKACVYVSKEQALLEVINEPEIKSYMETVKENPLPNTIRIEARKEYTKPVFLKELAETVKALPGVLEISYKQQETERLLSIIDSVKQVASVFFATALLALLFSSWGILRSLAHLKQHEVHAGKIKHESRRVLTLEFVLAGLCGGLLAAIALVVVERLAGAGLNILWNGRWIYSGILFPLGIAVAGGLLGFLGSLFLPAAKSA